MVTPNKVIEPGATLGVMGGGQLGRMFVHAAQCMGYFTAVLDAAADSPAGCVSHHHIRTGYLDPAGLAELARVSAAITTEFENVPAEALRTLAHSVPVAPGGDAVSICQDRALEKAHIERSGVPCAPHLVIETEADLSQANAALFPGILKTSRLGYDGKGQMRIEHPSELAAAWHSLRDVPCVLEKQLPLAYEISVVVARGADGACVQFPVQRNLHRNGILAVTEVPLNHHAVSAAIEREAFAAARELAAGMDYVGVLCVEFFVLQDGSLVANEMAPRPHNSGHWTIDGCDCSQFEAQVRAMAGLPLIAPRQHSNAIMLNLLGDVWFDTTGRLRTPAWDQILKIPGAHLHLYGKTEARRARKMGHLTLTAATPAQAREAALAAADILGIERWDAPTQDL